MRAFIVFSICIILAAENISTSKINVAKDFICSKLVPDVSPCAPRCFLEVEYANQVSVEFGNMLTTTEIADPPSIGFTGDETSYYTLTMIDPDVPIPSYTNRSQVRHWIVGNIPGDDVSVSSGETLYDYISPAPPQGDIAHRYAFFVYQQNAFIQFNETRLNTTLTPERFVPITEFVEKYELGCPIYGNFFLAQYDNTAE